MSAVTHGLLGARHRAPRLALLGCRGIPARYGGFETFAEELATRLVARGLEVTVYCEHPGARALARGPLPREHRGVRLEYVRVPRLGPARALLYDLLSLRRARADHEVVYMLGYGAGAFLGLGRRAGNEVWVNMDGLEWRRAKWGFLARAWLRRMERAALRAADRVVFDSAAVRAALCAALRPEARPAREAVIEYGARLALEPDPELLAGLALAPRGYFLLVARIEPENHVLEILRAHARAGLPQALLVVGDMQRGGAYGAACRAAAGRGARFLGPVFDGRTLDALRLHCLAALHGHSVGGTNPALLEAMAAGAAVLAHDNPFTREVLEERGLFFGDEDGLVEALRRAAAWSPEERARLGAANRARIEAYYTWERIAEEYARLLVGESRAAGTRPFPDGPAAALPSAAAAHGAGSARS